MNNNLNLSKFLSLILRHELEVVQIKLDLNGWVNVIELIDGINRGSKFTITREILEEIVKNDSKQRYSFNDDKTKIRANQGHSISVDLGLEPQMPPKVLYHGTATRFIESIKIKGLLPGNRNHVHLSLDIDSAKTVGSRHGDPYILTIDSINMAYDGYEFYLSANNIWLTNRVPVKYIRF